MYRILLLFLFIFSLTHIPAFSQQTTYSDINKKDKKINFDIIGNFNGNAFIYKKINQKNVLAIYNNHMQLVNSIKLDFISNKTFNINFINYPYYFLAIYQYQKGNIVYCRLAKIDSSGNLVGKVITVDTARTTLSKYDNNQIFYLTNSENKQKILIYKVQRKDDNFILSTKLFNSSVQMLDSTKSVFDFRDQSVTYDNLHLTNDGTIIFAKETSNRNYYLENLEINYRRQNTYSFLTQPIFFDNKVIKNVEIGIDNLNNQFLISSFFHRENTTHVEGLFTVMINSKSFAISKEGTFLFEDSTRQKLTVSDFLTAFNYFDISKISFKEDGGFILTLQEHNSPESNKRWNNSDHYNQVNNYNYDPAQYNNTNYLTQTNFSGYGYGYIRDSYHLHFNPLQDMPGTNDILIFSFGKDLQPQWNNIINKKHSDLGIYSFISFSTINLGAEIHYLFLENESKEVMSDFALQTNGRIIRNPTIKSGGEGYSFMPRLAKQVGARQIIVPFLLHNKTGFAKIDFL